MQLQTLLNCQFIVFVAWHLGWEKANDHNILLNRNVYPSKGCYIKSEVQESKPAFLASISGASRVIMHTGGHQDGR